MFNADVQKLSQAAAKKIDFLKTSPSGYFLLSALAGVYVAFGIALIFFIGAPLAAAGSPVTKLLMGAAFGIALTLVIFAGSELFTGNNMFGVVGALSGQVSWLEVGRLWLYCYVGNLVGSIFLSWLIVQSGLFGVSPQVDFLHKVAAAKMSADGWQLFVRAVLANWLVCLAVWTSFRATSETAKLGLIWWCLLGFIAPGYEHSVANMSMMAMSLLQAHPETVTWFGYVRNLFYTSFGNIVGGGIFVGAVYWLASPHRVPRSIPRVSTMPEAVAVGPR